MIHTLSYGICLNEPPTGPASACPFSITIKVSDVSDESPIARVCVLFEGSDGLTVPTGNLTEFV